jgi:hypothetical protein
MSLRHIRGSFTFALAAVAVTACGAKSASQSGTDSVATQHADSSAAAPAAAASAAPTPAADANVALSVADIDRWQHGMDAELKAVQDAEAQLKNAKTSNDTLNAMFAANETSTRPAGAKGAGVDEQRYQHIKTTLSSIVGSMASIEKEMDVSKMPAQMVAALKQGREQSLARATEGVPADVVNALRPRADELRKQDLALTAARLKAVQGAH